MASSEAALSSKAVGARRGSKTAAISAAPASGTVVWGIVATAGAVDGERAIAGAVDGERATAGAVDGERATSFAFARGRGLFFAADGGMTAVGGMATAGAVGGMATVGAVGGMATVGAADDTATFFAALARGFLGADTFFAVPLDAKAAAAATAVSYFAVSAFDAASPTSSKCARH